jgi:hypothetical protein
MTPIVNPSKQTVEPQPDTRTDIHSWSTLQRIPPDGRLDGILWKNGIPTNASHHSVPRGTNLVLLLLSLVVDDVVEAKLVNTLGGGHNTQPVTELLLLEELLGPADIISTLHLWKKLSSGLSRTGTSSTGQRRGCG